MERTKRTPIAHLDQTLQSGARWELASKVFLAVGLFLTPLMVGSWTSDLWEINKALVLLLTVSLAWICAFITMLRRKQTFQRWQPMHGLALGLVAAWVIGALVAVHPWHSLAGVGGVFVETATVGVAMVGMYILLSALFVTPADRRIGWASLLGGVGIALLFQMFQFSQFYLFPTLLPKDPLFSLLGNSTTNIAIIAAMFGSIALLFWTEARERWMRFGIIAAVAMSWIVVLLLGRPIGWAMFALGMIVVVTWQSRRGRQASTSVIGVAVGLAALGMILQFAHVPTHANLPSTAEIVPDTRASATITWSTLKARPVLGSGPATWYDDFTKYRPASLNTTTYWNVRFIKANNQWLQILATGGVVGAALWLGLLSFAAWTFWRILQKEDHLMAAAGLLVVGTMFVSGFFTTWSFSLQMIFWAALGLVQPALMEREAKTKTLGTGGLSVAAAVVLLVVVFWYPAIKVYASEIYLNTAQNRVAAASTLSTAQKTASIHTVESLLQTALSLNSHNANAEITLANAYLTDLMLGGGGSSGGASKLVDQALVHIHAVTKDAPNDPASYEATNNILRQLVPVIANAEVEAIKNFQTLMRLEPTNPIHDVGYGQTILIARARILSQTTVSDADKKTAEQYEQTAVQAYDAAIAKKPDYLFAHYAKAQALADAGNYDGAQAELNVIPANQSDVPDVWALRGLVDAKRKQPDLAVQDYSRAVTLDTTNPQRYLDLAQQYLDMNQKDKAKTTLQAGLTATKNDPSLTKKLDEIK